MHSTNMARASTRPRRTSPPARRYTPPAQSSSIPLSEVLFRYGRGGLDERQFDMLKHGDVSDDRVMIHYAGDLGVLELPAVSVVGTRQVTDVGRRKALQLSRDLAEAGVLVISGLAKGVDAAAHTGAMQHGGSTAAVIGTPLSKAYPIENAALQEEIYGRHLLISPFAEGTNVFKGNFPARNRVMAALSDATVIIEASDTSGTLHQAAECLRLGRWLFILKSVVEDKSLQWPARFLGKPFVEVLNHTEDLLARLR
jgi:DNA protecting protein DprA